MSVCLSMEEDLVVGVGLGESGWMGFGLQVNGGLSWCLFEEKVGEVK